MSDDSHITEGWSDEENGIWHLKLNRPDAANAYSEEMVEQFCRSLKHSESNPDVRVVLICGEGKHFSAGGDIHAMRNQSGMFAGDSEGLRQTYQSGIQEIPRVFENLTKPIIAAIQGAAIGAGLDLACMCDIRIASDRAKFGETFAKLGLIPGDGGGFLLQRIIGYARAMELTLSARIINATEAEKIGLIHQVVAESELMPAVLQKAREMSALPSHSLRMAKQCVRNGYRSSLQQSLDLAAALQGIAQRNSAHLEAIQKP